ncbi:MAG: NFACT RNA binding domain-containing protein, partial [Thermoplasmata archaeon]|nr:NFACT RNA binding domain-containing protein [Thermoplasmata archaeon]
PVDAAPLLPADHAGLDRDPAATSTGALALFFDTAAPAEMSTAVVRDDHRARIAARQRESLKAFRREADELAATGDVVYEHYLHFASALEAANAALKGPGDWATIAPKLPPHVRPLPDFGWIEVQVPGTDRWVGMEIADDVNRNVARLYDRAKRLRGKADGAERAIAAVRARKDLSPVRAVPRRRYTRDFWYEKFKWTMTTGGRLLLAGRDARTNEELVRRHLKDGDIFVHADVHGAPSCVLKGGASASEGELREACSFAAIHSKAWSGGLGSVPAYWVLPDQVSRTPESGEYLPKGGFIVRGKRNFEHHIAVQCCVGVIVVEGKEKVVAASRQGVAPLTRRFIVLEPGDTPREKCSEVADFLASPVDEVSRALPGDFRIVSREG